MRRAVVGLTLTLLTLTAAADPRRSRDYDEGYPQWGTFRVPAGDGYYHSDRPIYTGDRDRYRYPGNPYGDRGQLVQISGNTRASGRKLFDVRQPLDRIIIEATAGSPVIHRVSVEYADRNVQDFDLREQLPPGGATEVDLPGHPMVHRMEVVTDRRYGGAYVVLGAI
ncbi:MAG: hypothetical protein JWP01_412 [Myxococcales bacterium]|nr:hypothetical protein [Myxococcales bacterium]